MASFVVTTPEGKFNVSLSDDEANRMSPQDLQAEVTRRVSPSQGGPAAAPEKPKDQSGTSEFVNALHGAGKGLAATARVLGADSAAGTIDRFTPDAPANFSPASTEAADAIRRGEYWAAIKKLPRMAIGAAPDVAAGLASGAAGAAMGGPVGGAVGAGTYAAARGLGENVEGRAEANNHVGPDGKARPTTNDYVLGGLTTVPQAVLGAVAANRIPGVRQATERLTTPVARAGANVALEGVGNAGQEAVGQFGRTAGTERGLDMDGASIATAGMAGAAARAAHVAPGLARAGVHAASDQMMSRFAVDPPVSTLHAKAISEAGQLMDTTRENLRRQKGDVSDLNVANNAKQEIINNLTAISRDFHESGALSDSAHRDLNTVIEQARRHNNSVQESGSDYLTAMDRVSSSEDLPTTVRDKLVHGARVLDELANQSFAKNQTGPLQALGRAAGHLSGVGVGLATHNPWATMGAVMGHSMAAKIGGGLGMVGDRVLGTSTPTIVLRAQAANRMLKKAGLESNGDPLEALSGLRQDYGDPMNALNRTLNIAKPDKIDPRAPTGDLNEIGTATRMTPAEMARGSNLLEGGGRFIEQSVLRKAKAAMTLARKSDEVNTQASATDEMAMQRQADITARTIEAQRTAGERQNANDRQAADLSAAGQDRTAASAEALKTAQENAMFSANDRAILLKSKAGKALLAAVTRSQSAGNMVDMAAQQRREPSVVEVSGAVPNQIRQTNDMAGRASGDTSTLLSPRAEFEVSNGMRGSPVDPNTSPGVDGMTAPSPQMPQPAQARTTRLQQAQAAMAGTPLPEAPRGNPAPSLTDVQGHQLSYGWKSYVHKGLNDIDVPTHAGDVRRALDHIVQADLFDDILGHGQTQAVAEAMGKSDTALRGEFGRKLIQRVVAVVAAQKGVSERLDTVPEPTAHERLGAGHQGAGTMAPSVDANGQLIRNRDAYAAAIVAYQDNMRQAITEARMQGRHDVANTVSRIQNEKDPLKKAVLRGDYLRSVKDPMAREEAAGRIPDWMVAHGNPKSKKK